MLIVNFQAKRLFLHKVHDALKFSVVYCKWSCQGESTETRRQMACSLRWPKRACNGVLDESGRGVMFAHAKRWLSRGVLKKRGYESSRPCVFTSIKEFAQKFGQLSAESPGVYFRNGGTKSVALYISLNTLAFMILTTESKDGIKNSWWKIMHEDHSFLVE